MLSGKDQHLACIKAKGTFDTRYAVTDSARSGGRPAYAIHSTGAIKSPSWFVRLDHRHVLLVQTLLF